MNGFYTKTNNVQDKTKCGDGNVAIQIHGNFIASGRRHMGFAHAVLVLQGRK
ncbi:hypothetical protein KIN20_024845 [Parelaphostrongylus tenuis]|uniref:Uncharacterized protein n=1 Tax=Parelaphostrongylus tenuis TaxID=148309 RepID=A0AAD5N812_PARTN|nr:hypothetical protein KIN20_024845 [Parelaphostrongylus tenuis]